MLKTAIDLSAYQLAAGEPFLLEVQLQESNGAIMNLSARRFALSFYGTGRTLVETIDGELLNDATGSFLRFARDGRFSDALFGQDLTVELAERYKNGRNVLTSGKLSVLASAGGVQSLDSGVVGQFVVRINMRASASSLGTLIPTQQILPYQSNLGTPAPAFTILPSISRSGMSLTGNDGTITNGTVQTREWLLNGTAINGANGASYVLTGKEEGQILYRVTAKGAGGSLRVESAPIDVTAAITLGTLTLSTTDLQVGFSYTINILGATDGSAIAGTVPDGMTINSAERTITGKPTTAAKSFSFDLAESHPNATNSPRRSTIAAAIAPAPPVAGDMVALKVRDATQLDPDTGSPALGISGNGWVAEVTLMGLATPAPDASSDALFNCNALELLVSDPGFRKDSNGKMVATTVYRRIRGRVLLRKQFKTAMSDTNGRFITTVGDGFMVMVTLGDQLYAGSTIESASLKAGFYVNGAAKSNTSAATSLTNASAFAYRKATVGFLNEQGLTASADYPVELISYHRHAMGGSQVAGVVIQARDTTGNVTPAQTVSAPRLSGLVKAAGAPKLECFPTTIPLATLNQDELCFVNAVAYPWIGDASAIYDLAVDGTNTGLTMVTDASPHTRLRFTCDKAGTYGSVALVDANAAYTPIASGSASSTPANAFDGNYSTGFGWLSTNGGTDQWVGQTFPVAVAIEQVRIWASGYGPENTFNNFDLEYSDDGQAWTKKGTTQVAATWTTKYTQTQSFAPGGASRPARYWRVRQNGKTASGSFTGAQEIEFATSVGGVNVATGAAALTLAAARLTPVTTPDAAYKAIRALNKTKGRDDYAGFMYLGNKTADTIEYGALASIPAAVGLTWCTITPDPAASGPVKWTGKAAAVAIPSMTRALGLTIKPTPGPYGNWSTFYDAASASGASMLALNGCVFEAASSGDSIAGSAGIYGFAYHSRVNCTSTLGNVLGVAGPGNDLRAIALALGNVQGAGSPATAQIFAANRCEIFGSGDSGMPAVTNGYFVVNNEFRFSTGVALDLKSISRPTVIAQNLFEFRGNNAGGIFSMNASADSVITPVFEYLDMHNTRIGNRGSRMYLDDKLARGVIKHGVSIGNVDTNYNIKTDTFEGGLPGNTGNWRYLHQVGMRSNVSMFGSLGGMKPGTGSYLGMAWEPDYSSYLLSTDFATNAALFRNWQGQRNDNAAYAGGGDYHLASSTNALTNRVPRMFAAFDPAFTDTLSGALFAFDQDGRPRLTDGTGAVGCYERP
jgi:hypothetical protein